MTFLKTWADTSTHKVHLPYVTLNAISFENLFYILPINNMGDNHSSYLPFQGTAVVFRIMDA